MDRIIKLESNKKVKEYQMLLSFINEDDEEIFVYKDVNNKNDEIYAYIGKKNGENLTNDISSNDLEVANKLLEKLEKDGK